MMGEENQETNDIKGCEPVYKNEIELTVFVAPIQGSAPRKYRITGVNCPRLPFLNGDLDGPLSLLQGRDKKLLLESASRKVREWVSRNGLLVDVNPIFKPLDAEVGLNKFPQSTGSLVNLFVDMGSTNSKWIVCETDDAGANGKLRDVVVQKTESLCKEWAIDYDKQIAYKLSSNEFEEWLLYAALGFMCHQQQQYRANVQKIYWSFPRFVEKAKDALWIDFEKLSRNITKQLKEYGLGVKFTLVPEGEALRYMFADRMKEIAKASELEVSENESRAKRERITRQQNKIEREKADDSRRKRREEIRKWEEEHPIKKFFGCEPKCETELYAANIDEAGENLGRLTALQRFRSTGARGDGDFDILILDAGGSTFDYCYVPKKGDPISGSYRAGGNDVTRALGKIARYAEYSEEKLEGLKFQLAELHESGDLKKATETVYSQPLSKVKKAIRHGGSRSICVIATGLAMRNSQLRRLVRQILELPEEQLLIFSPDMVELFPRSRFKDHPAFKIFCEITCRNDLEHSAPWPANDVSGGLFFANNA